MTDVVEERLDAPDAAADGSAGLADRIDRGLAQDLLVPQHRG